MNRFVSYYLSATDRRRPAQQHGAAAHEARRRKTLSSQHLCGLETLIQQNETHLKWKTQSGPDMFW